MRADGWVELPDAVDDAAGRTSSRSRASSAGPERLPRGRVLVVGNGFIGRLFGAVLERRGDTVFAVDRNPQRAGVAPDGPVDAAVLCAPGGAETALDAVEPGGTVLLFADAGTLPAARVYRRELTVIGSRSATPAHMEAGGRAPARARPARSRRSLPLERFEEGLALFREGRGAEGRFRPVSATSGRG